MEKENNFYEELFDIDFDDIRITKLLREDPTRSYKAIGDVIDKSQPAVGARVLKLERKGLLCSKFGMDVKSTKLLFVIVKLYAKNAHDVIDQLKHCPFISNVFLTTGRTNLTIWFLGFSIEKLEQIIAHHLRSTHDVANINIHLCTKPLTNFILPVDMNIEKYEYSSCSDDLCKEMMDLKGHYTPSDEMGLFNEIYDLDIDDKRIIMELQKEPEITHAEIGRRIDKSQPAVGTRITKLKEKKLVVNQKGCNFKDIDKLHLMQVSINAHNLEKVKNRIKNCSLFSAAFHVMGKNNVIGYVATPSLYDFDNVVERCFRSDENVTHVESDEIVYILKDLILPFDFELQYSSESGCLGCEVTSKMISTEIARANQYQLAR